MWTDDSLLEAAALRPDEDWLQRLAMINRLARERGHGRHDVTWFARVVREKIEEQDAKPAKPHKIEVVEEWVDGGRIITVRNPESDELVMTLRTASLCPDCVSTALRGVLERFEAEAKAAR